MGKQKKKIGDAEQAEMQEVELAADRFKALGDPTRLRILRYLIDQETEGKRAAEHDGVTMAGANGVSPEDGNGSEQDEGGVTITEIARLITGEKEITSSISHHIKELRQAGLITVERDGKKKRCYLARPAVQGLLELLEQRVRLITSESLKPISTNGNGKSGTTTSPVVSTDSSETAPTEASIIEANTDEAVRDSPPSI